MPQITIPLLGNFTNRPGNAYISSNKDQRLEGCFVDVSTDDLSQQSAAYLCKRPGWANVETIVSSQTGAALFTSSSAQDELVAVFGDGKAYFKNVAWYAINATGNAVFNPDPDPPNLWLSDGVIGTENYYFIRSIDGDGFYLPQSVGVTATPTFTANTTSGSPTLSNVSSFVGLFVGQALSGTGIQTIPQAKILSMNTGASTITMTENATANGVGVTITFTPLAQILATLFTAASTVTPLGPIQVLDGWCFVMTLDNGIRNSSLNDPQTWPANGVLLGTRGGNGVAVIKRKNTIVAFYSSYFEVLHNTGNQSGSPLTIDRTSTTSIGANDVPVVLLDNIFWIGSSGGESDNQIYMLGDGGAKKISTPQIDRILSQQTNTVVLSTGNFCGYDWVFAQSNSGQTSFMYCVQLDKWLETNFAKFYVIAGSRRPGQGLFSIASDDSDLLRIQETTYQDDSVAFSLIAQTEPKALNGGLPFIIDNITLLADTQSSGSTTLATSADDYATFGTVGSFDLTQQQKNLPCGGYYDSTCAFRLTDSGNNAWRGQAFVVKWRPA